MAQLVVSAAGAAIGFAAGGPVGAQIGWVAGSVLGSVLGPKQRNEGPRLQDLKVTGSSYGQPIPWIEGHPRVAGQVIWASAKREVSTTNGGKGGPSTSNTTFTYEVDLLILLSANQIAGARRIWSNGKLVWTAAADADSNSLANSVAQAPWTSIVFHGGDAAQLPDATYEAAVGAGNAPAYRGRGTVMVSGLQLGTSGQLPNLTFEIGAGIETRTTAIFWAPLVADGNDTISPTATSTTYNGSGIAYGPAGASFDAGIPGAAPLLKFEHAGGKLNAANAAYSGDAVSVSVEMTIGTSLGAAPDDTRFFIYDTPSGADFAFSVSNASGYVELKSYYYHDFVNYTQSHGAAPVSAVYKIKFDTVALTCSWYVDSTLLRTESISSIPNGSVNISSPYTTNPLYGIRTLLFKNLQLYTGEAPVTTEVFRADDPPLDAVVGRLCARAGLATGQIDAVALSSKTVRSMAIGQVSSTRAMLETLAAAYLFDAVESDKLNFVLRGGASAATIPYASLGASAGQPAEPLPLNLANDIEAPVQVTVRYVNVSDDYQDGSESSDRLLGPSGAVQVSEVPLGLTPQEAKTLADITVMDVAASLRGFGPVALSLDYAHLEPTDVVTLTDSDGTTYRARILKDRTGGGIKTIEGVIEDASILTSTVATTTTGYTNSTVVAGLVDTTMQLLDIPLLRDADDSAGFYAAFKGTSPWPGATLYDSVDNVTYTQNQTVAESTQLGTCTTTLGNWAGGTVFDESNTVTVDIGTQTLTSYSRDDVLNGVAPGYVVGSELLYARTAALVSAGVYTLSGLLRGRRGTEWAMTGHTASERFAAMPVAGSGLRRVALSTTDIGVLRYYKGVTSGRALSTATAQSLACQSIGQKPFAPVGLRKVVTDTSTGVTWARRTRYATRITGAAGISAPLGEASEAYTVELRDGGSVLVSTETVTAPTWSSSGAIRIGNLISPAWGLATISGELVGIRDDLARSLSPTDQKFLIRFDTAGASLGQSPTLGNEVYQWANNGDELYAVTADFTGSAPVAYLNAKAKRVTRTAIGTVAATYTAATAGDLQGIASDGTDVWVSEYFGGNLRKLNPSTLASVATYAVNTGLTAIYHDAGKLWVISQTTSQIVQWDIATTTEVARFSVGTYPYDALVVGSLIFVQSANEIGVYTKATGVLVNRIATVGPNTLAQRSLKLFGAYVTVAAQVGTGQGVLLLDSATGLQVGAITSGTTFLFNVAGSYSTTLYLTTREPGVSLITYGYQLLAPALTGYTLTVSQLGANGAGYPASITL